MKPLAQVESWEAVSRKAYWDRDVSLEKWRERVSEGHRSYLPGAVLGMDFSEFVHFYGVKRFIRDWPILRAKLPEQVARKAGVYDMAWGRLAGGGWNLRPFPGFHDLPESRRLVLVAVCKTPGRGVCEMAGSLGIPIRTARKEVALLMRAGKVRAREVEEAGRRKTGLYPSYGCPPPKTC